MTANRSAVRTVVAVLAVLVAAAGLTGCGDEDRNGAEQFVVDYYRAGRTGDWATVCRGLEPKLLEALGGQASCTREMRRNATRGRASLPGDVKVTGSTVADDGTSAVVRILDNNGQEQEVRLLKVEGEWKVTG